MTHDEAVFAPAVVYASPDAPGLRVLAEPTAAPEPEPAGPSWVWPPGLPAMAPPHSNDVRLIPSERKLLAASLQMSPGKDSFEASENDVMEASDMARRTVEQGMRTLKLLAYIRVDVKAGYHARRTITWLFKPVPAEATDRPRKTSKPPVFPQKRAPQTDLHLGAFDSPR